MKLKFNLLMMAAVVMFAACSDDENSISNPAKEIAGSYQGYTVTTHGMDGGIPETTPGETISIKANEDGTCTVTYELLGGMIKSTTDGVQVSLSGNKYSIKGEGTSAVGMNPSNPTPQTTKIEGTISKDKSEVSLVLTTVIGVPMGTMKIVFTLGDAPAAMVVAKAYTATLSLVVSQDPAGSVEKHKVTVKTQEDGKAEVTLAEFSVVVGGRPMSLKEIVIPDVTVTSKDGGYELAGTINAMSGTTNVTGTLAGIIKDGEPNLVFTMIPGKMPMEIVATFTNQAEQ